MMEKQTGKTTRDVLGLQMMMKEEIDMDQSVITAGMMISMETMTILTINNVPDRMTTMRMKQTVTTVKTMTETI